MISYSLACRPEEISFTHWLREGEWAAFEPSLCMTSATGYWATRRPQVNYTLSVCVYTHTCVWTHTGPPVVLGKLHTWVSPYVCSEMTGPSAPDRLSHRPEGAGKGRVRGEGVASSWCTRANRHIFKAAGSVCSSDSDSDVTAAFPAEAEYRTTLVSGKHTAARDGSGSNLMTECSRYEVFKTTVFVSCFFFI